MMKAPLANTKKRQARPRRVPQRMCVVCRETSDKRSLTRIVRTGETSFAIDPTGRANGRGAYVCDSVTCREALITGNTLARALRVTPDVESIELLKEFAAGTVVDAEADATTVISKEKAE